MSFSVWLKEANGLRGRFDRIAKLTFREKSKSSDVYESCSEPAWEQEFDWPLTSKLMATDSIEVEIFNYTLFRHRFIGRFHMYLKKLVEQPETHKYLKITDHLVDANSTVLKGTVTIEILVTDVFPREVEFSDFHPVEEVERVYSDWELETIRTSGGGSRYTIKKLGSTFSAAMSRFSQRAKGKDAMSVIEEGMEEGQEAEGGGGKSNKPKEKPKTKEKFNLHPKVRVGLRPARENIDWNVQLRVIEGTQIAGTQLDPVCDVHCFGQVKSTAVKEQTNCPYWDEFFVFDTTGQRDIIFDDIVMFKVYSGRTYISKGELLGIYKIDIGTIYHNPDHRFLGKYGCLIDPVELFGETGSGIKGFIKVDITVLAFGDPIKEPPNTKADNDVEANPLLPEGVRANRTRTRTIVRIYKAEGLPKLNSAILAKIRKEFSGEPRIRDLADPFVKVEWAGMEASTSVRYKSYDPEWTEEIVFCDIWPTLCRRIKVILMDKDAKGSETVATHWIDLSEISNDGCNTYRFSLNAGFMPTFGPAWVNLYGSSRDYLFNDPNHFLNRGIEEGIGYRGRLLLAIINEEGESAHDEEISNIEVKGAAPVPDVVGGKEDTFQLFCCIHEATLIDRKTAKKPIRFEMNIGNFGNTIDGKLISWKEDDDDDEDGEDKFVHPLTEPMEAETIDREYYNMPFHENKPCLHIRFMLEDQRKRLYIQNILHKLMENLEDGMEDVVDKLAIDAEDTYEFLQDALKGFIEYCDLAVGQLSGKITGPKAGRTKLDKERLNLCVCETKKIKEEADALLKNVTDNTRINSNVNKTFGFRDRVKKLMHEPQESTPDVFIWLLSNGKRHSYVRIPAHKIMYSSKPHECGRDSGQLQTYFLTLPGVSGLGEKGWAIQCKLQALVWLGLLKNKKDMIMHMPQGYIHPHRIERTTAPPPAEITYTEKNKYTLRAHIYQARGLVGSDDSGLSDAFARVLFLDNAGDTKIIWETRSPSWDQTMIFYDLIIWGEAEMIKENPPVIVTEIFDFDEGGDIEFIGRVMSRPLVKLIDDPYAKPLFPPKLEWFDIFRGESPSGELLAAYELFQVPEEGEAEDVGVPPCPEPIEDEENGGVIYYVPNNIRPVMAPHRIECLFWGVREMKMINLKKVNKPRVEMDCMGVSVSSEPLVSAKVNPNYPEPWTYFDLDLPEEDRYCPPLTISVKEIRMFGKEILVGTSIVSSLLQYLMGDEDYDAAAADGGEVDEEQEEGGGEEGGSKAGSKSGSKSGSKTGSKAGSKAASKTGSKAGSKALSLIGSKAGSVAALGSIAGSRAAGSKVGSAAGSRPASILSKRAGSIAPSIKSVSFAAGSKQASISGSRRNEPRPPSVVGSISSQINHHIRSTPGTPVQKKLPPRKSPTGSRVSGRGSQEAIEMKEMKSPGKRSLTEAVTTPIKSIGSKLATPRGSIAASRVSLAASKASKGSKGSKGSKKLSGSREQLLQEDDELALGAEASDYFPPEEGDEKAEVEDKEKQGEGEGEDEGEEGEEKGEEGGEGEAEGEVEAQVEEVIPLPGLDDEEEGGEQKEAEIPDRVMVGEAELKAELQALEEAAEDEEEADEEEAGDEEKEDAEGGDENEEQVDWWSRFYETIRDEERIAEEKKRLAKKNKSKEPTEDGEEEEEEPPPKMKIINPRIIRLKIYKTELEEHPAFDGFSDVFHSFNLLRGKSNGNDDDDESRIYGKFKGMLRVWRFPLPDLFEDQTLTLGSFKKLPTPDPVNVLCRVYIVRAIDLHPTDMDGKADPYVRVQIGNKVVNDRMAHVPKQLNPNFGKMFDFEVRLPHNNMLHVAVWDYDLLGTDSLIGETKIDIEDRFFSKHRATCGLSLRYHTSGYNSWRDPIKPAAILQRLCKDYKLNGPHFQPGKCRIEQWIFCGHETIEDEMGMPKQSDEPSALVALHHFNLIRTATFKGFPLVPEHVETRSLMNPNQPGIEQGRVQLWVDLFSMEGPPPQHEREIRPRKPTSYELRCIIWNTEDVILGDINVMTGKPCADIYVKGWLEGLKGNAQQTDIHTSSLTGEGNFNWRFIFPFKFHRAEEKIVITKKPTLMCWTVTEVKMPLRLILQCWDADLIGTDDFVGDLMLNLCEMPKPSKTAIQCNLELMNGELKDSIFKKKLMKGWWPFVLNTEEAEPELVGKVDLEMSLVTEAEAEEDPYGLARKDPHALPFPNRPDLGFKMFNPLAALKDFLWAQYKGCLLKFAILAAVFAVIGLFLYTAPPHINNSLFG